MVVDDDEGDVLLIQRAFRKTEVREQIHVVGDGEQAIAYLAGRDAYVDRRRWPLPRVVLLDLTLPRCSGFEVLEWRREDVSARRVPVVVFSSSDGVGDVRRAYDLGANSYLVKPLDFETLRASMESLARYWLGFNHCP